MTVSLSKANTLMSSYALLFMVWYVSWRCQILLLVHLDVKSQSVLLQGDVKANINGFLICILIFYEQRTLRFLYRKKCAFAKNKF